MDDILVLDSETQSGLSLIRSLGRHVSVTAGSCVEPSLGMVSNASSGRFVHPDPEENSETFIDALNEHLNGREYDVVFPVSDQTTALIARHKSELEETGTTVATEDWETFVHTYDKAKTFELVEDLDVPTPATVAPESADDLADRCSELQFPVVVKSRSKSVWDDDTLHLFRVLPNDYVHTEEELVERYRSMLADDDVLRTYPPIVQQVIEGETTTTTVLADDGDIRAYFQERRLRTFPAVGGNSTLLTGIYDTEMLEHAERIIEALGWTGPAQVEFMRTPSGESYLIEVNGRYWGSLPLAIESGVDFPWLHYRLLQGLPCDLWAPYRTDVTQRRLLFGDIKWLIEQLENRNPRALVPFVRDFFTSNHTFFSLSDPSPTALALRGAVDLGISTILNGKTIPHDQW